MSPAHVLEPTYDAIKRSLLSADWKMGTKLEATKLADDLGVSITPVRDSLNRLFGEHLVDFVPGEGFRVPVLNERQLRDLLDMNSMLLTAAATHPGIQSPIIIPSDLGIVDQTALLFLRVSGWTKNEALIAYISSLNDRLRVARNAEGAIFADLESELSELVNACQSLQNARKLLGRLIARYHERRRDQASLYMRLLSAK